MSNYATFIFQGPLKGRLLENIPYEDVCKIYQPSWKWTFGYFNIINILTFKSDNYDCSCLEFNSMYVNQQHLQCWQMLICFYFLYASILTHWFSSMLGLACIRFFFTELYLHSGMEEYDKKSFVFVMKAFFK